MLVVLAGMVEFTEHIRLRPVEQETVVDTVQDMEAINRLQQELVVVVVTDKPELLAVVILSIKLRRNTSHLPVEATKVQVVREVSPIAMPTATPVPGLAPEVMLACPVDLRMAEEHRIRDRTSKDPTSRDHNIRAVIMVVTVVVVVAAAASVDTRRNV
ncbi:hypothetical protein HBI98_21910 [Aeromonas veronii]|nr:hypothetical protein [Aeromonas veronii]